MRDVTNLASQRPNYGLDAPSVVRNLFLCSAACLLLSASAFFGLWKGVLSVPLGAHRLVFPVAWTALWPGLALLISGSAMIYSCKVGKLRDRERLLDLLSWRGDELVLDVGCGRGLLLAAAARSLSD
jgi:arsenite methyltransferase